MWCIAFKTIDFIVVHFIYFTQNSIKFKSHLFSYYWPNIKIIMCVSVLGILIKVHPYCDFISKVFFHVVHHFYATGNKTGILVFRYSKFTYSCSCSSFFICVKKQTNWKIFSRSGSYLCLHHKRVVCIFLCIMLHVCRPKLKTKLFVYNADLVEVKHWCAKY